MCEINPKRSAVFTVEFWTAHEMTDQEWRDAVYPAVLDFEKKQNERGNIRVHVHEADAEIPLESRPPDVQTMIKEMLEADMEVAHDDFDDVQYMLEHGNKGYLQMTDDEIRRDWAEWKKGQEMENDKLLSADERRRLIAALAERVGPKLSGDWEAMTSHELLLLAHRLGVVW